MARIMEVFNEDNGSWLVPTCLSCKQLLPLFGHAYSRWIKLSVGGTIDDGCGEPSTFSHARESQLNTIDSPAILLADIMHWFAVLDIW